MLRFQIHVKKIRPAQSGPEGLRTLRPDGPIPGDNARSPGRIPRVVLEFPPA